MLSKVSEFKTKKEAPVSIDKLATAQQISWPLKKKMLSMEESRQ